MMNLPQGAMDDIWNHSQFDEHYEMIQSGGYEKLYQTAGATGTVAPAGATGTVAPTENSWMTWVLAILGALVVLAILYGFYWLFGRAQSDPYYDYL